MTDHDGDDEHSETDEHSHGHHDHSHDDHDHDHSNDHDNHEHHAHDVDELGFAVVTVSTSRSVDDDPAGDAIKVLVEQAGHDVVTRELVADDHDRVQKTVNNIVGRGDTDVVVTTGGTGVTPDDVTIEAVSALFEKELPGFGELFRKLSYDEIGTKTVGTRATAGTSNGTVIFCLPGSENAVRLGVGDIVLEEAGHLVGLAGRE
ncbi:MULTISPECIES: molybdenum cofactor biosynthesis protein B [unclassified Haladaptatus]|uniref:MogA/MoaB family molybdenum cofactor biosynthesis protein n=1 Tax=unclassified Haladaptatus TaxID=2622732 RepID=UPI00209C3D41|nr:MULTISPECIES: molybdenum cofactor biosynthesis protein B [unclassified Haladaptatus]MCO8243104.1 molybdenum cofactor biosynthesis protein MoaB [Haladaptatus sp. AB643]MCO8252818.1 molybdenum cofactor biosynthesis protein MoaB [Haladaptatus sp. AB618]